MVIAVKANSHPDDWTEIICSCWAFYPLFCFPGIWLVSSSRQEDLANQLPSNAASPLPELDFLCNIMRPAAGMSVANMGNQ